VGSERQGGAYHVFPPVMRKQIAYLHAAGNSPGLKTEYNVPLSHHEKGALL